MATKRAIKRRRARERRKSLLNQQTQIQQSLSTADQNDAVEYLPEALPEGEEFQAVFQKFAEKCERAFRRKQSPHPKENSSQPPSKEAQLQKKREEESDQSGEDEEMLTKPALSNKKRKLRDRLTIAQLKQLVDRPDLVELHDPNSPDPTLLVHLKSTRNTVPVPGHWLDKKRYLQDKRGVEKPVFQLPKAIQETGVVELRRPGRSESLKQKQRQRMNPRLGRLDIDYQKLHAAFFKNMVKPRMTSHGDIYHLGKENEVRYRRHRPGALSKRLKNALHMMENHPPPYLINMQRFGPPPSYTQLRIPGLNAPIPPGCKYGYAEGQWGKPPVNDNGYPKYGDPFGVNSSYEPIEGAGPGVQLWGAVEENVAYEEEFEDEEMEEAAEEPAEVEAAEVEAELVTEEKTQREEATGKPSTSTSAAEGEKQLYRVLDERKAQTDASAAMGSTHTYEIEN